MTLPIDGIERTYIHRKHGEVRGIILGYSEDHRGYPMYRFKYTDSRNANCTVRFYQSNLTIQGEENMEEIEKLQASIKYDVDRLASLKKLQDTGFLAEPPSDVDFIRIYTVTKQAPDKEAVNTIIRVVGGYINLRHYLGSFQMEAGRPCPWSHITYRVTTDERTITKVEFFSKTDGLVF